MQCEKIQIEISSGTTLAATAASHLASCATCQEYARVEAGLSEEARRIYGQPVPDDLRERIRNRIVDGLPAKRSRSGWSWLAASAVTAALLSLLLLGGSGRAEAAYRQMLGKISEVASAHLTLTQMDAGPSGRKVYELWWKRGAWREKSPADQGGDRLKLQMPGGLMYYHYDPQERRVTEVHEVGTQIQSFDVKGLQGVFMPAATSYEMRQANDHSTTIMVMRGNQERMVFATDSVTGLPLTAAHQFLQSGGWKTSQLFAFDFNNKVSDQVFEPSGLMPKP
jgi:hypothetical protein